MGIPRKAKRDGNEKEIIEALRRVGATVQQLSIPNGPDLLVGFHGENYLFEVKQKGKELRMGQVAWKNSWHGFCLTIRDPEDAVSWIGLKRPHFNSEN